MSDQADYITREGLERLEDEFEHLRNVERRRVTAEVAAAAAQGDRSENAEYIYGKKRLREIDARLRHLSKRIEAVTVVEPSPEQAGRIYFGAWITLEDEDGEEHRYRIVGADEFDVSQGRISIKSPMARALIGRCEGDEVFVRRPKGDARFTVVAIAYEEG